MDSLSQEKWLLVPCSTTLQMISHGRNQNQAVSGYLARVLRLGDIEGFLLAMETDYRRASRELPLLLPQMPSLRTHYISLPT